MEENYRKTLKACYIGFITQAILNNLAPLLFVVFQDWYDVSFEMLGRLILINFMTQIVADLLAVKYASRLGYRTSAIIAHICSVLGLVSLAILPQIMPQPYIGLVISVMIYALGGGIIEVLMSPIVESLPFDEKSSEMSLLHSFYCWGQVVVVLGTTLLLKIIGTQYWSLAPLLWAIIPLSNIYRFMKVPLMPLTDEENNMPLQKLFSSKVFIVALILMLCAGASELTMSQWSSLFAEKGLQVSKVVGDLLGPCLFAVFMGIGRTIYGKLGDRINIERALLYSSILCIVCYLITALAINPFISLIGCAICGLSVSLLWPGTFSLSSKRYPQGGVMMFGLLAIFGDLGASIGPWMAGFISNIVQKFHVSEFSAVPIEQVALKTGILISVIFPIILLVGILVLKREKTTYE